MATGSWNGKQNLGPSSNKGASRTTPAPGPPPRVGHSAGRRTFAAAVLNQQQTGSNKLYLTLLGGGAFGNRTDWILHDIRRAMSRFRHAGLEVAIVTYGRSNPVVQRLVGELR